MRKAVKGVYYRKHKTRKHGVRYDRYWIIRQTINGKQINEGLGYSSEGMSQAEATSILKELKDNKKVNINSAGKAGYVHLPETYNEMQELLAEEKREEEKALQADVKVNEPFSVFFERFVKDREEEGRPHGEIVKFRSRYKKWIDPVIGRTPARKVTLFNLKKICKRMSDKGAAPSTVVKVIGIISHSYSHNIDHHKYEGKNPVNRKKVLPEQVKKHDNKRHRFLTPDEAKLLLAELPPQLSNMARLSLLCGLRAGEIFTLRWSDINLSTNRITLFDTKSGKTRTVAMGKDIVSMLTPKGKNNELVFPKKDNIPYKQISRTFRRIVDEVGLNDGISDRRQRVVFHTLRHTCASWLVHADVGLYTVKEVLGHSSITVTERYVHGGAKVALAAAALDEIMGEKVSDETLEQEVV